MSCASRSDLLADLAAELLGADERVVQRLVTLAEGPKLLVESLGLRLELLRLARQPLELLRDLLPELLDPLGVVAAQPVAEVVAPHVERCEMKGLVH